MAPKIVDKHQRKLDIVQAALTLFEDNAIAKTTIAAIAKEAKLSKGSFYELFENKTALIIYIIKDTLAQMDQGLESLLTSPITVSKKIEGFVMGATAQMTQETVLKNVAMELWRLAYVDHEAQSVALMLELLDGYLTLLEKLIQEGIDSGEFLPHNAYDSARTIGAIVDGLKLQKVIRKFDVQSTALHAITTYLKGISC